jgi:hypothetical protein
MVMYKLRLVGRFGAILGGDVQAEKIAAVVRRDKWHSFIRAAQRLILP